MIKAIINLAAIVLIPLELKSFCGVILSHFNVQIWEQPVGQTL